MNLWNIAGKKCKMEKEKCDNSKKPDIWDYLFVPKGRWCSGNKGMV
jgi:hypothetical protein